MTRSKKNKSAARGPKPNSASPPPPLTKIQLWSKTICDSASGRGTAAGLNALGPVNTFQDLLLPAATSSDPKCVVAAEQIIHLVEGWRYAAAATSAYLSHSAATATHFAYYAEMRAAMSLFAWSGIRLKWGNHYFLDSKGVKQLTSHDARTHEAVWALWPDWVGRNDAQQLIANAIKLHPLVSLDRVIKAINFTRPGEALKSWGLDLVRVANDHTARNTASYDAGWIKSPLTQMAVSEAELIREIWNLFLQDGTNLGFDAALCSHFIESSVDTQVRLDPGKTRDHIRANIAKHISDNSGAPAADVIRRLDPALYKGRPFKLAASSDTSPENVLCRAFFLLRIALLAMKGSLGMANAAPTGKKWIENWLEHAGIWAVADGIDPQDIEVDYRVAVDNLKVEQPLPSSLWTGGNLIHFPLIARPDACIAWSIGG